KEEVAPPVKKDEIPSPAPVIKEVVPVVPKVVPQPPAVPLQAPVVSPQVPVEHKEVIPKKEKKKQPKEVIISKPVLTVTEVRLPTARKPEIKKPSTLEITEERLKLLEEKVITLSQNYEQERKELASKLGEKDKIIKQTILYTFLIFLFFIFLFQQNIRNTFSKSIRKILTTSSETVFLPTAKETEKIFSDWLNTLENKEIVQIVVVLLNNPEENIRAKGFEFLEKIMKTKKFTADEQWKIERTIRKIGLEEGWVGK
ncbi:MAG TPA: hypothetical protein DHV62_07845, partial [Elusimicrobia bacterium]|nr:hypothetical protein [Elusimicrobiota bacterium]